MAPALAIALAALALPGPGAGAEPAAAQEPGEAPPPAVAPRAGADIVAARAGADTVDVTVGSEPAMPEAPLQFRISVAAGVLAWREEEGRPSVDDGGVFGLDVESRIGSFLAFRLGAGYGRTAISGDTASDSGTAPAVTDVNQYLVDFVGVLRLGFDPLDRTGVVPFGTVGLGAVVHDPSVEELATRSQSAAVFGAGLDIDFARRFGGRLEWRRYVVDQEDIFAVADRTGNDRSVDRFLGTLYWKL